jgi:hypothetical protein
MDKTSVPPSKQELIASYKGILRTYLDQRPSGVRQKIAQVLGTHKSFVSLITNPVDATPIPARHLEAIMDVCHLSGAEKKRFLEAYNLAHPEQAAPPRTHLHFKTLHIQVPVLKNQEKQEALELLVQDTVRRLYNLFADDVVRKIADDEIVVSRQPSSVTSHTAVGKSEKS